MKKWWFILIYILLLIVAYQYKEHLLEWIKHGESNQIPLLIVISIFLATIPIIPFTLFAGMMGAKYGMFVGGMINWIGSLGASMIMFLLSRYVLVDYFRAKLNKFNGMQKFNSMLNKNAFMAILFARMVPIVPTPVVNIYSAISFISFRSYAIASGIGKIPSMLVFAFIGNQLFKSFTHIFYGLSIYLAFIGITLFTYRWWMTRKS